MENQPFRPCNAVAYNPWASAVEPERLIPDPIFQVIYKTRPSKKNKMYLIVYYRAYIPVSDPHP